MKRIFFLVLILLYSLLIGCHKKKHVPSESTKNNTKNTKTTRPVKSELKKLKIKSTKITRPVKSELKKVKIKSTKIRKNTDKLTQMKLNNIASILSENSDEEEYHDKNGKTLLEALISDGMIKKKNIKDAWGQKIRVKKNTKGFCVISAGPDQKFNTRDDIYSSDCKK